MVPTAASKPGRTPIVFDVKEAQERRLVGESLTSVRERLRLVVKDDPIMSNSYFELLRWFKAKCLQQQPHLRRASAWWRKKRARTPAFGASKLLNHLLLHQKGADFVFVLISFFLPKGQTSMEATRVRWSTVENMVSTQWTSTGLCRCGKSV